MQVLVWLRYAAIGSLSLIAAVAVTTLIFNRSLASAFEWSLIAASFGGALGSITYRQALAIPAASWHALRVWAISAIWGAGFALAWLSIVSAASPSGVITAVDVAAMFGIAAATSVVCFIPLRWLQETP